MGWEMRFATSRSAHAEVTEVVGKQRARTVRRGGKVTSFTPEKTRRFESEVRTAWVEQVGIGYREFPGPVRVDVCYSRELAKSNPKFWAGRADLGKPDADNVLKAVLDALSGVAFSDDSQVVCASCKSFTRGAHGTGNAVSVSIEYYDETYEKGQ